MTARGMLILAGEGPRARAAVAECARVGLPCAVLRYADWLAEPERLGALLAGYDVLRVDSPDRDFGSLAAPGTIGSPAQLYFGLRAAVARAEAVADWMGRVVSHRAADIARTHDKLATHAHLGAAGIAMPSALGPVAGFDALMAAMRAAGASRVFLKLRHGSAAAGMMALAMRGDGTMKAITTAVLAPDGPRSTRKLRRMTVRAEIAALVDALGPLGLFAERWMPKATVGGGACDLRVVAVGGELFPVLRISPHPMTNLHLGGERAEAGLLAARMGAGAWDALMGTAARAAAAFPGLASLGIDIAAGADFRRHAVIEVNAFGDFVKGLERDGVTPAAALVRSLSGARRAA